MVDIGRIALDSVVDENRDAEAYELVLEGNSGRLILETGYADRADENFKFSESIDKTECVLVVSNAEVASDLAFFDVFSIDYDDNFSLVGKLNRTLGGVVGFFKGILLATVFCMIVGVIVSFTKNGFLIFTRESIEASTIFGTICDMLPFFK